MTVHIYSQDHGSSSTLGAHRGSDPGRGWSDVQRPTHTVTARTRRLVRCPICRKLAVLSFTVAVQVRQHPRGVDEMPDREWWRNPVIIVPSVATIVAAVIGGIFAGLSSKDNGSTPHGSPVQSPSISSTAARQTGEATAPSSFGAWSKQWGPGAVLLSDGRNVDLDSVPPNDSSDGVSASMYLYGNQYRDGNGIALWTGNGGATAAACASLIRTQGVSGVKPVRGGTFCAKTNQGNIAILIVQRIDIDSNDYMTATLDQVTVWSSSSSG